LNKIRILICKSKSSQLIFPIILFPQVLKWITDIFQSQIKFNYHIHRLTDKCVLQSKWCPSVADLRRLMLSDINSSPWVNDICIAPQTLCPLAIAWKLSLATWTRFHSHLRQMGGISSFPRHLDYSGAWDILHFKCQDVAHTHLFSLFVNRSTRGKVHA